MALTKGQKKRKWTLAAEAKAAETQAQAEGLWNATEPKFTTWVRQALLENPAVWQWIRLLYIINKPGGLADCWECLIKNSALSDQDLANLEVARKKPLEVLQHPNCGDECLKIVAELWEHEGTVHIECVPNWASGAQIDRMYELRPSCKHKNAILEYAAYCNSVGVQQVKLLH